ncbi:unnamed protein product [Vitrella brassicaformis CCMP3155]|uniref:PPM-type phosphatase domain-containing protein n=2 Tax=Vitrella brassicaformis TaxID=1169539 RepID=A0A0G4EJ46_VITBC|nr:unnamed protein product [Vitrella brassicaformis CCMP3155]|eukprot:CEL96728.1 unnamed protein product [Vitrella brassicaformis CCMP3155]
MAASSASCPSGEPPPEVPPTSPRQNPKAKKDAEMTPRTREQNVATPGAGSHSRSVTSFYSAMSQPQYSLRILAAAAESQGRRKVMEDVHLMFPSLPFPSSPLPPLPNGNGSQQPSRRIVVRSGGRGTSTLAHYATFPRPQPSPIGSSSTRLRAQQTQDGMGPTQDERDKEKEQDGSEGGGLVQPYNSGSSSTRPPTPLGSSKGVDPFARDEIAYFAVFDGHGGKDAAQFARDNLHHLILLQEHFRANFHEAFRNAFLELDRRFLERCSGQDGSTALVCLVFHNVLHLAHIGDSRAVLATTNDENELPFDTPTPEGSLPHTPLTASPKTVDVLPVAEGDQADDSDSRADVPADEEGAEVVVVNGDLVPAAAAAAAGVETKEEDVRNGDREAQRGAEQPHHDGENGDAAADAAGDEPLEPPGTPLLPKISPIGDLDDLAATVSPDRPSRTPFESVNEASSLLNGTGSSASPNSTNTATVVDKEGDIEMSPSSPLPEEQSEEPLGKIGICRRTSNGLLPACGDRMEVDSESSDDDKDEERDGDIKMEDGSSGGGDGGEEGAATNEGANAAGGSGDGGENSGKQQQGESHNQQQQQQGEGLPQASVAATVSYRAVRLTHDHKPNRHDEMERIRRAGGWVVHVGCPRVSGHGVQRRLAVSRAFGNFDIKRQNSDLVIAEPECYSRPLQPGDRFMVLCSDGVWDVLSDEETIKIIANELDGDEASPSSASSQSVVVHPSSPNSHKDIKDNTATSRASGGDSTEKTPNDSDTSEPPTAAAAAAADRGSSSSSSGSTMGVASSSSSSSESATPAAPSWASIVARGVQRDKGWTMTYDMTNKGGGGANEGRCVPRPGRRNNGSSGAAAGGGEESGLEVHAKACAAPRDGKGTDKDADVLKRLRRAADKVIRAAWKEGSMDNMTCVIVYLDWHGTDGGGGC